LNEPQQIDPAGLLVLSTNSGTYQRDVFGVASELGTTLGYYLTPRLRATFGYTFLYLSRVARPGDVIDREINEDYIPNREVDDPTGPARPEFVFRDSDYWAQGINVGLDLSW
jgi:hypothetical protein